MQILWFLYDTSIYFWCSGFRRTATAGIKDDKKRRGPLSMHGRQQTDLVPVDKDLYVGCFCPGLWVLWYCHLIPRGTGAVE